MLAGKRRGHQFHDVGKQKLCVLRLVIGQGDLQIVKVCPYEGEIDRFIYSHDDHLSLRGSAGRNKANAWSACEAGSEIAMRFPLSQHPRTQKGLLVPVLASSKARKSTKSPALYARLAIKPDTILSRIGKKEERLHELLILHRVLLHV